MNQILVFGQVSVVPTTPAEMVLHGTMATKVVLALLVVLSLVSWAIMFAKWRQFSGVSRMSETFMHNFERSSSFEGVVDAVRQSGDAPQAHLLRRASDFLREVTPALAATPGRAAKFSGSQVEALRLLLDSETNAARDRLARYVPSLGTIGSVSPLIGLLGTVLGVIEAFIGIASQGSGNIGAVAPGVAEALIATAAALAVAIPAVFGYNLFANRLNRIDSELEAFGTELIALLVREGRI
ncbi:MAG: MotA/TolQ/ExbB proton channel family protein [Gemmatimonadota bacterium]|nr:MotA/TolQ/ExbB proton channel family protein [Gemmatimonadota bacterium]